MSISSHLAELERKHHALDKKIMEEQNHPNQDDAKLAALKRKKLVLKDEISRLREGIEKPENALH